MAQLSPQAAGTLQDRKIATLVSGGFSCTGTVSRPYHELKVASLDQGLKGLYFGYVQVSGGNVSGLCRTL